MPLFDLATWIKVEQPDEAGDIRVHGRNIYILPTRFGVMFGVMLFLMLIGSMNYVNNPAYLLTFLLLGVGLNAIYQTWRNLRGISVRPLPASPVFAGEQARFCFILSGSAGREQPAIQLHFDHSEPVAADVDDETRLCLGRMAENRGWFSPGRLTISTTYPLGLLHAWCYVDFDIQVLVYPAPRAVALPEPRAGEGGQGVRESAQPGTDDFIGLRTYHYGDHPRQIDWKALARERGLMTKLFGADAGTSVWLNWGDIHAADDETRLGFLTYLVIELGRKGRVFGLRLPRQVIEPGIGRQHERLCLESLALYGLDS